MSILSAVWMFLIVLFHCSYEVHDRFYAELMSDCRMGGVGYFFVVSGYFVARSFGGNSVLKDWIVVLRKRVRSLAVPYLIWCTVGLVCSFSFDNLLNAYGIIGICPTANNPLWYVKFLFCFAVVSPGMIFFSRVSAKMLLAIMVVLLVVVPFLPVPMKFSLWYSLAWFSVGIAVYYLRLNISRQQPVLAVALGAIWLGLFMLRLKYDSLSLRMYSASIAIVWTWCLSAYVMSGKIIGSGLRSFPVFFIYCSHAIVLGVILRFPLNSEFATLPFGAIVLAFVVYVAALLLAVVMSRCCPKLYSVVVGGRN